MPEIILITLATKSFSYLKERSRKSKKIVKIINPSPIKTLSAVNAFYQEANKDVGNICQLLFKFTVGWYLTEMVRKINKPFLLNCVPYSSVTTLIDTLTPISR